MKKAFHVLKDRPKVDVILTRDSVCAGDDSGAPHKKLICVHSFIDPEAFARETATAYLSNVEGTGHSWICVLNDVRIAEISANGIRPLMQKTLFAETNRVHFIYRSASY